MREFVRGNMKWPRAQRLPIIFVWQLTIVILLLLFEEAYVAIFFVYISQKILNFLNGSHPITTNNEDW